MQQVKGTNYIYMNKLDNIWIRNDAEQKHKITYYVVPFSKVQKTGKN